MAMGLNTRIISVTGKTPFFSWGNKTTFTVSCQSPDQARATDDSAFSANIDSTHGTQLNPFTLTDTAGNVGAEFNPTNRKEYDPRYVITSPQQTFPDVHLVPDAWEVYVKVESQSIPITPLSRKGFTFKIYGHPLQVKFTFRGCQAELSDESLAKIPEPAVAALLIFTLLYRGASRAD